ncbi:hypothetical protein [Asticcacaulis taihuensis]|uniref:Benenodin family lasso peptide n=1 Tax=Asticcacaulis taihuensis TaxID=260084 RepID=A0A1G4PVL5_9CAUL|nr:hypothetical protein [Asticcacaulis taihuensis]SCW36049.1 hypothetical protein SAMN02927928_0681 [Asticcacaulis taihuensis]
MTKNQHKAEDLIDLGNSTVETRGSVPGKTPDNIQPLQYPAFGLSAD